jgi:hypothetical protein
LSTTDAPIVTTITPPAGCFFPGTIAFDATVRAMASEDARQVLQTMTIEPDALVVEMRPC